MSLAVEAPVKKEKIPIAVAFNALEELLGNDLVGIHILPLQGSYDAGMGLERLHSLVLVVPAANIGKAPGNGSGRGHRQAYQAGAAAGPLPSFKISVPG